MADTNFYTLMARHFSRADDAPALIDAAGEPLLTWHGLARGSAELAGLLAKLGLEPGDRVVAQVDKSPEAVLLYLACLRQGVIYIPLNTAYTASEIAFFLDDAAPALCVCRPASEAEYANLTSAPVLTLAENAGGTLISRAAAAEPVTTCTSVAPDDVAAILYTSGTTGKPKGAMLTHGNLISNAQALTEAWGWQRDDVLLHALPVYHAHGLFVGVHLALCNGSAMIFLPAFSPAAVIDNLPRASVFMGVPTFYSRLLAEAGFDRPVCSGLRLFISGSAPLRPETFNAFEARTGHLILERYGMTEALMITSNPLDGERRAGTVGFPLPGVKVRVVGEDGVALPMDDVGALEIAGPNVFKGYWRQPDKTAAEFTDDGYFRTGDLATLDAAGRVTLVGRNKDLIISGGLNVYPKEVENAIDAHAAVSESAVIGVPHPDFGEAVVAVVVPADTNAFDAEKLDAWLREGLAGFKCPKKFRVVTELPRNAMGKVQKNRLRELCADYFTA